MDEATNDSCPEKYPFKELFNHLASDNADEQYKHGLKKRSVLLLMLEGYFMWVEAEKRSLASLLKTSKKENE